MKTRALVASLLVALAPLASGSLAHAVGARAFELDTLDDLSGGEMVAASVDSRGHVRPGLALGNVKLGEATSIWSALPLVDGSVLLGTGNEGKVIEVKGADARVVCETGQLAVTSLVGAFDGIYAGTMPNGRIMKLEGPGDARTFVDLPDADHVFALAYDAKAKALYAATGPHGRLYRIDAAGHAQTYFDSDEPHLVSLALAADGSLFVGSSGKALLFHVTGPGRASVVYDFPGEDVKAIALGAAGSFYVASNEYADLPELPKRAPAAGGSPAAPVSAVRPKPGKGTLTRFDAELRPERLLRREDTHFVSLAIGDDGRPYVGTGVEGRVYAVDEAHGVSLVADTDERQVGAMLLLGPRRFVATSDPPVFHEVRGVGGPDSYWTSKVLDAGLRARFGRLDFQATGAVALSTRSGDTLVPDATWSDWTPASTAAGAIASPSGRFLQLRARFPADPRAELSNVRASFVTSNLRPIVTSVDAAPRGASTPPSPPAGTLPASGGDVPSHTSVIKITWKVDDPDADALRYRLAYRREDEARLHDLTRPDETVTKTEWEWETAALPEGRYRVRVEASDEAANPPERVERHALESALVTVDNTPPVFEGLALVGQRLTGKVKDGVGPIARIDFAVDGRAEWRPLASKDGVLDEATEELDVDLSKVIGQGPHAIAVRAYDASGNYVVRDVPKR